MPGVDPPKDTRLEEAANARPHRKKLVSVLFALTARDFKKNYAHGGIFLCVGHYIMLISNSKKVVHVYTTARCRYIADLYEYQDNILVLLASTSYIERPVYLIILAQRAGWQVDEW